MNKTLCLNRKKIALVSALMLLSLIFVSTSNAAARTKKPQPVKNKAAEQHTIYCSAADNPSGKPCQPFYIFPRSIRTIIINKIQPGKRYQCYFSGYHTWKKPGTQAIMRQSGLVGLSLNNLKIEKGSDINAKLRKNMILNKPLQIDASSSKNASYLSFDIRNHTQNRGDYITVSCHEVNSFPN